MEPDKKEEVVDQKVDEVVDEVVKDEVVDDRPIENYRAELARKNAALEKARQELEAERAKGGKRDPDDMSTWPDHELKVIINSKEPQAERFKEEANDLLLERKVRNIREKERLQERRTMADLELRATYPESLDPTTPLSLKIEEVMSQYDLQKSPAGRLAAAKIAAAELGKVSSKSNAKERKAEADRVARVKGQMVDGDRSKSTEVDTDVKKVEEVERRIKTEGITQADGVSEALKLKGMDRKSFFGR